MRSEVSEANGMWVLGQRDGTIFVRLPAALQRPISSCVCEWCRTHPEEQPMWDTMAIKSGKDGRRSDYTWTVHMPNAADAFAANNSEKCSPRRGTSGQRSKVNLCTGQSGADPGYCPGDALKKVFSVASDRCQ